MIIHQLFVSLGIDEIGMSRSDTNVFTSIFGISNQRIENNLHVSFHVDSVFLSHGSRKRIFVEVSSGSDSHGEGGESQFREIENSIFGKSFNSLQTPVVGVFGLAQIYLVILLKSFDKEWSEFVIVFGVHGVASHA